MYIGLFLFTIFVLSFNIKGANKVYIGLILLQLISFLLQFLVGRNCVYHSMTTFLNLIFVNTNLMIIIFPWKKVKVKSIVTPNIRFIPLIERFLYPFLWINIFINIIIAIIVYYLIPDIAHFKLEMGFKDLYDQVPYFGTLFRFASVTSSIGLIAIPLFFFYLSKNKKKSAYKVLLLSSSTLIHAIAVYSRALMFTYVLSFVFYYLLIRDSLPDHWRLWVNKRLKYTTAIFICVFLLITFVRFSSSKMDYYGERIPPNSIIKDPVTYSIFDYASQGYPCGIECLEYYKPENCMNGEYAFYDIYMILGYFHIINWNFDDYKERMLKAFSGNFNGFKGYVASSVCDFGYILTCLFNFFFFFYLKNVFKNSYRIRLDRLIYSFFLLLMAMNVIFYNYLPALKFPFMLILLIQILSKIHIKGDLYEKPML